MITINNEEYDLSAIQVSGTNFAVSVDAGMLTLGEAYAVTSTNCGVQAAGAVLLASGMFDDYVLLCFEIIREVCC